MTRDDIIRMAREAHGEMLASGNGMSLWHEDAFVKDVQDFCERFAALVAAAEREACAKLADSWPDYNVQGLAEAIRARSES